MKKILIVLAVILCVIITGCGAKENAVSKDVEEQLKKIKTGNEDFTCYDIYNRLNISDTKLNIDALENKKINNIFNGIEWKIKDIQVNNSTALVTLSITAKDVDDILSKDYMLTEIILDYASYIRDNPNADREELDSFIIDKIVKIIQEDGTFTTSDVMANAFLSSENNKWEIAYDDNFIDALVGKIEKQYAINMDDICEEAEKNVDVKYDYNKILNLPASNRTTRSSIKTPILFNEEAYFDNSDYFFQKERYEAKVKVSDVIRGSKAKEIIDNASDKNTSTRILDVNSEYILFKVDIKLMNNLSSEETIEISAEDFSLLDSKGHFYNNCIVFGLDELSPVKEGEKTSGYVCFTIDKGTNPFLLFKDYMDNTLVFSN